jgi:UDP-N-acetylglucosamine transferase subunit ALG13
VIFLTVGTQFPFDRLVRAVDEVLGRSAVEDEVFAQVGSRGYRPRHMEWVETLEREAFGQRVAGARALIGHAGTGTILTALEAGKPLLVMPRLRRYGEVVNDHQVATARKFAELGHVLLAYDEREIPAKLAALDSFIPVSRHADPAGVIARLRAFLDKVSNGRR